MLQWYGTWRRKIRDVRREQSWYTIRSCEQAMRSIALQHSRWWDWYQISSSSRYSIKSWQTSQGPTCWKHWMTTPSATRLKFWLRPPEKSSLRDVFFERFPFPSTSNESPSSSSTASLIAWNICCTFLSSGGLSSRAEITAIARADWPDFKSLERG